MRFVSRYAILLKHIYKNKYIFYNEQFKTIVVCKNCIYTLSFLLQKVLGMPLHDKTK